MDRFAHDVFSSANGRAWLEKWSIFEKPCTYDILKMGMHSV